MAYPGKEPALYQLYRHTFVSLWFDEARTKWRMFARVGTGVS